MLIRSQTCLDQAVEVLIAQPSAGAPGWGRCAGEEPDLAATARVALAIDPTELPGRRGIRTLDLALDHLAAQVEQVLAGETSIEDGHALAIGALLRHRPDDTLGSRARSALADALVGPTVTPLSALCTFAEPPSTAGLAPRFQALLRRALQDPTTGSSTFRTARIAAELDSLGATGADSGELAAELREAMDPVRHLWTDDDGQQVFVTCAALGAFVATPTHHPLTDAFPDIAEAICKLALTGGGWGQRDPHHPSDDEVDNLATAAAIRALRSFLRSQEPPRPTISQRSGRLIDQLYQEQVEVRLDGIPESRPSDHTMFEALDLYAQQKLPSREMAELLHSGGSVEVHGTYPTHLPSLLEGRRFTDVRLLDIQTENQRAMATTKRFNTVRPHFYRAFDAKGREVILVAVGCGDDYVMHYASMVRHACQVASVTDLERRLRVVRYPTAEEDIAGWTGLDHTLVAEGDRVVIGYVEECRDRLGGDAATIQSEENSFYGSDTLLCGDGRRVTFLGVKFSFWGSISRHLAARLCHLGASEIIYVGKLGALSSPEHLYDRIFAPTSFAVLRHDTVEHLVDPPPNPLLERSRRAAGTGMHVSIPTVLEEDYAQRRQAEVLEAASIDNEISQIALAITDHNRTNGSSVGYATLHFATDYIRTDLTRMEPTDHDLAKTRTPEAKQGRRRMLDAIVINGLAPHLQLSPTP